MKNDISKLKQVAAVHDISGYGKCSLTVAIPILSAMGLEVLPVPSAVLSMNTEFPDFSFLDLTNYLDEFIGSWKHNNVTFDAVYSGFLGSKQQIQIVKSLITEFSAKISIVDPVMGDNGKLFKTYNDEMCNELKSLVTLADIITPNVTEACILTGQKFFGNELNTEQTDVLLKGLQELGCENVVITGITNKDKLILRGIENGENFEIETELLDFFLSGTGDLFTSVLTGAYVNGDTLINSIKKASGFVINAMQFSKQIGVTHAHGVAFEPLLKELMGKGSLLDVGI